MEFYIVDKNLNKESNFAESEHLTNEFKVGEPERCPVCHGAVSMLELLSPIEVKLTNKFLSDFIYGEITPFIVSESFKNAYLKSGLVGIRRFKEVHILKVKSVKTKVNLSYFLPEIVRSEARIDEVSSLFNRTGKIKCEECKRGTIIESFERLRFLPDTWSGEDIFYAKWLSGAVFVSRKFIEFIHTNKFSNVQSTNALDYSSQF